MRVSLSRTPSRRPHTPSSISPSSSSINPLSLLSRHMAGPNSAYGLSRFHAIVSARSLNGNGPPVIHEESYRLPSYSPWPASQSQNGKRAREQGDAGPSTVRKSAKKTSEDEAGSAREPTTQYCDRNGLLAALQAQFRAGPDVDFHGKYEVVDPGVTHKQRIQTVAHEIWKATGYRFTVKDHPQFTNGHKTRFWCSQDEAHRSKSSRAARKAQGNCYKPRVTSAGEAMAKARYPCRSRLLVSSRDSSLPGNLIITVRMHHHVMHEPYVDTNIPPDVAQSMLAGYGWATGDGQAAGSSAVGLRLAGKSKIEKDVAMDHMSLDVSPGAADEHDDESSESEAESAGDDQREHDIRARNATTLVNSRFVPSPLPSIPPPSLSSSSTPVPPPVPPPHHNHHNHHQQYQQPPTSAPSEAFHSRMKAHIKNLREFCEGLEYQLQFNDYRMLDVLEREGGSFLGLVEDCLRKEGRLAPVDRPAMPQSVTTQPLRNICADVNSSSGGRNLHMSYEINPGINPRALNF